MEQKPFDLLFLQKNTLDFSSIENTAGVLLPPVYKKIASFFSWERIQLTKNITRMKVNQLWFPNAQDNISDTDIDTFISQYFSKNFTIY